jgi:hypothetical protein
VKKLVDRENCTKKNTVTFFITKRFRIIISSRKIGEICFKQRKDDKIVEEFGEKTWKIETF